MVDTTNPPDNEESRPGMEPLTPEELEQFLARARAQGRLLTPEERTLVFGSRPQPTPDAPPAQPAVGEMEQAWLDAARLAQLSENFYPELGDKRTQPAPRLVQGVIFDFDDTLALRTRPLDELMAEGAQAAVAYMRSAGMELPDEFWPNVVEARRFAEEKSAEEQEEHLADDAMSFLLQFFGYPASKLDPTVLHTAVDLFYAPEMTAWRLHEGVAEMLQRLHEAGYKLALLANYNLDRAFQRTVDYLGLRRYFDLCLSSASVEYRKPDTRLFQLALDRWDLLPYEVVVVGDSLREDIAGGIELGALTALCATAANPQVVHENSELAGQVKPDATLADLRLLPAQIDEWADD